MARQRFEFFSQQTPEHEDGAARTAAQVIKV